MAVMSSPPSRSLAITGLISVSSRTRSRTTMCRLECDPASQRERRFDGDAVDRDVEVATGKTVPMNVTNRCGSLSAERRVDFLPLDLLGVSDSGEGGDHGRREGKNCSHWELLFQLATRPKSSQGTLQPHPRHRSTKQRRCP